MRYVGFSEYYHDAALAIIEEDGNVSFAAQAERYSKKKNDSIIPEELWDLTSNDDYFVFYEDHQIKRDLRGGTTVIPQKKQISMYDEKDLIEVPYHNSLVYDEFHLHHVSHCAMAYYTRPWTSSEDTVLVSIDGVGEIQTACVYDSRFNLLKEWHAPKSVGIPYTTMTKCLGLRPLEDEYVVMGLSSYGEDKFSEWLIDWFYEMSDTAPEVEYGIPIYGEGSLRNELRAELIGKLKDFANEYSPQDCAASVQKFAEVAILGIMKEARKYGNKLVYSGGVAQNVVVNSMIHEMFDEVHIAIAPTDAGSALGAAARTWAQKTGKDQLTWTPYLGYDIQRDISPREVVDHIIKNKVCGIAHGRAEFGPRALGNRSLIADVRYDVKDTVNEIKRRHKYRPFAPAILAEHANKYFSGPMNEYMQYTSKALHDYKSVIHVDGTSRVQLLQPDCPSILRKIVEEYYERTGVPMLLNTSLNIRGRPMVNDEKDARLWENKYKVKVF